jgi:hypothetical protein
MRKSAILIGLGSLIAVYGAAWACGIYFTGAWPTVIPFAIMAIGAVLVAVGLMQRPA